MRSWDRLADRVASTLKYLRFWLGCDERPPAVTTDFRVVDQGFSDHPEPQAHPKPDLFFLCQCLIFANRNARRPSSRRPQASTT
jgi:hypothetical protein